MITVTKEDIDNVVYNCRPTAHYATIFCELTEVYEPGVEMTLDDMLQPFAHKKFKHQIPGWMEKNRKDIRYADYIIPLFYAAYVFKHEHVTIDLITGKAYPPTCVMREIMGLILQDNGHFYIPPEQQRKFADLHGYKWGFHFYWGDVTLSNEDKRHVDKLYEVYLSIKPVK